MRQGEKMDNRIETLLTQRAETLAHINDLLKNIRMILAVLRSSIPCLE
jgi:hypothetical protein